MSKEGRPGRLSLSQPVAKATALARRQRRVRDVMFWYSMILPSLLLVSVFTLFPLADSIYRSFFTGGLLQSGAGAFVGFANYVAMWAAGGGNSLLVTFEYAAGFVLLASVAGFGVSLLLNIRLPGVQVFRTIFILPLVLPIVATAIVWLTVFNPFFGIVDRVLRSFGVQPIDWFATPTALLSVILFSTWWYMGHNVILFLAAIKGLPAEVLEAARIDGATPWQRVRYVSFPLVMPSLALIMVITTITALQAFTQVFVLTRGGPVAATTTAAYFIYQQAFQQFNTGSAEAMASVLFVVTLGIAFVEMKVLRRFGAEGHY